VLNFLKAEMTNPLKLLFVAMALLPLPALAYMGPGAGITAVGVLLALLAGIWYTAKGFLWLPLKRMLGKGQSEEDKTPQEQQNSEQASEANKTK
jgi:hypothetical protein